MSREEFLNRLEETLTGEVPVKVIRENLNYYGNYISQELSKGRTVEEIVEEIGDPRLIARTIIDSSEAAGETLDQESRAYGEDSYDQRGYGPGTGENPIPGVHYFNLNKWYWKLLLIVIVFLVVSVILGVVGGIFSLLMRFAGPILVIGLIYWFLKNLRR